MQRIKNDIHYCSGLIQEPKLLTESVVALHRKHVTERDIVSTSTGGNITSQDAYVLKLL